MSSFREYLGALDDYLGDDDEMLGAPRRRRSGARGRRGGVPGFGRALAPTSRAEAAAHALTPPIAGVPKPGARLEPLGFPAFAFVVGGATTITQQATPQKPFKGSRLVIDTARTNAGASASGLVTVTSLKVGVREVLVSAQPIGAGSFAPNAFGVELMMDEAVPGVLITLTLAISAAPTVVGDRVDCAGTIIGLSWS